MNPELDLDNLELTEEVEEVATPAPEVKVETNPVEDGREIVRSIIGRNIFDVDLGKSLDAIVNEHFDRLPQKTYSADIYQIPDLNMKIWQAFHDYEDFIYANKFENIDLQEIAKIIREQITPKITEQLRELSIQSTTKENTSGA
jgi:hypothetical protein